VRAIGADLAQGYFIAEPAPADEVAETLRLRRLEAGITP
jgi:EAL domain-containing protein (putative c-di-GMP-specific phosphodiesterase class I)